MTFLRAFLNETFRQENQSAHLHPLGNNVADDLSPFALRIHAPKQDRPAGTGQDDEDQQRVSPQEVYDGVVQMAEDAPAFDGLRFQQKFRAENNNDRSAPVSNRIAEERAKVRGRVCMAIENNPEREQTHRNDAQGVALQESLTFVFVPGDFRHVLRYTGLMRLPGEPRGGYFLAQNSLAPCSILFRRV
jgi:hypothetical protein